MRIDARVRQLKLYRSLLAGIEGDAGIRVAGSILDLEAQPLLVVGEALKVGGKVAPRRKVERRLPWRRQQAKAGRILRAHAAQYDRPSALERQPAALHGLNPVLRKGQLPA